MEHQTFRNCFAFGRHIIPVAFVNLCRNLIENNSGFVMHQNHAGQGHRRKTLSIILPWNFDNCDIDNTFWKTTFSDYIF